MKITFKLKELKKLKGGQGSGHHGHSGRPGKVGGSSGSGGSSSAPSTKPKGSLSTGFSNIRTRLEALGAKAVSFKKQKDGTYAVFAISRGGSKERDTKYRVHENGDVTTRGMRVNFETGSFEKL